MVIKEQIIAFESKHNLIIPKDLKEYFESDNNKTLSNYSDYLFEFYSLEEFRAVKDEVGDFSGIPDYRDIVNVLPEHENCFVFAEYMIHSGVYAIRLYESSKINKNEIYAISGSSFRVVADSFTRFIDLYKVSDLSLFF